MGSQVVSVSAGYSSHTLTAKWGTSLPERGSVSGSRARAERSEQVRMLAEQKGLGSSRWPGLEGQRAVSAAGVHDKRTPFTRGGVKFGVPPHHSPLGGGEYGKW